MGMRVDSSRKCSETDLIREKVKHRVAGLWVQTLWSADFSLRLGTKEALAAWGYKVAARQDWSLSLVELEAICKFKNQLVPLPWMQQEGATDGV